ncbi:hypothetical protein BS50DRAFT_559332 [Corynespora cassiicola Philippines]|uniref:U6 snRNA phosphodiesterase n=1 Tax=Corynespora cassiicola Philippines TaxID=1448308 RepID=A0A2T2NE93_CORCC|nr:hypothetical protein BS50DRAFT_559332 [Corynespora cassiicola Philippines]
MSLVAYPDSASDSGGDSPAPKPGLKRKRGEPDAAASNHLPPLPAAFHDLYSTNARVSTSDDPSLHGGRKRAVPHIKGNWPSHVFLEWVPSHAESGQLHSLIDSVRDALNTANKGRPKKLPVPDITPSLLSPLGAPLPLHVSLSRTLQIRTEERGTFLDTLTSRLRTAAVRPFHIQFTSLKWVPNFERNRWFLVLGIEKPAHNELNRLLTACNEAAEQCGHPGLYTGGRGDGPMEANALKSKAKKGKSNSSEEVPRLSSLPVDHTDYFHISIAWNLVEPDPEWVALVQGIPVDKHVKAPGAPFEVVKAKIGNAINNIALRSKHSEAVKGGSILGLG